MNNEVFERISYMSDDFCKIQLKSEVQVLENLMNLHLILEDDTKKILAEVDDVDAHEVKANFLGEIVDGKLVGGTIRKPSLNASIRVIDQSEIPLIVGADTEGYMKLGVSPFYNNFPVYLDVNSFFSNHFAIFGNTGSGKSCGTTRLFQNMFHDQRLNPYKANLFIFDSSGEYYSAFSNLNQINSQYNYRYISTDETEGSGEPLRLPIYLLNKDDLALLLQCDNHSQLPIIERMLKLALVFSQNDVDSDAYKNHLIAKAIMSILYTNQTAPNKRNEIFSIIASCSTKEFNLEAPIQGIGYVRKFRECFLIDNSGNFTESVLLTEYLNSFIKEEFDDYEPHKGVFYTLDTLEKALNFTLISEGWLRNEQTYGDSVTLKVRLHSLIVGDNAKYFDVKEYLSLESYISSLLVVDGRKYQIVNINLNGIDDDFAKVLTKVFSRLLFDFSKNMVNRASIPFHIILEEAHRYIQNDRDRFLLGYNIFERIAKEGRKYGVILGLISQRPVEISDTVISQCNNFLIFKITHPLDVDYIRKMLPNITDEIVEKQKSLQAGTCLGFGLGFKIPIIVRLEMPNPAPSSGNCDVVRIWKGSADYSFVNTNVNMSSTGVVDVNVSNETVDVGGFVPTATGQEVAVPTQVSAPTPVVQAPSENAVAINNTTQASSGLVLEVPKIDIVEEPPRVTVPAAAPMNAGVSVAEAVSSSWGGETENEKFDDSFIVMDSSEPIVDTSSTVSSEAPANVSEPTIVADQPLDLSYGPVDENPVEEKPFDKPAFEIPGSNFELGSTVGTNQFVQPPVTNNGLSEIAEVNISSNGMISQQDTNAPGGISLELDDDDDDDGIDFD